MLSHPPKHPAEPSPQPHPDPAVLESFLANGLTAPERRRVVRHLLAGCPRCVEVTRRAWHLPGAEPRGVD